MFTEKKLSEFEMLKALCEHDALTDKEREAFESMMARSKGGRFPLSPAQRDWVEGAYKKHELDAGEAQNLVSSGQVPRGKPTNFPFETMVRPLKPPGRS
jgi:hypothetical protein